MWINQCKVNKVYSRRSSDFIIETVVATDLPDFVNAFLLMSTGKHVNKVLNQNLYTQHLRIMRCRCLSHGAKQSTRVPTTSSRLLHAHLLLLLFVATTAVELHSTSQPASLFFSSSSLCVCVLSRVNKISCSLVAVHRLLYVAWPTTIPTLVVHEKNALFLLYVRNSGGWHNKKLSGDGKCRKRSGNWSEI